MNFKSVFTQGVWALCLSFLGSVAFATTNISGTITQTVGGVVPSSVGIYVTTTPLKDPNGVLDPKVFIASQAVAIVAAQGYSFPTLPHFTAPTNYYLFAFRDYNLDGVMNGTEPAGGYGPFPVTDTNAQVVAPSNGLVFNAVNFNIFERAEVTGTVTNNSAQPGQRLIVHAVDTGGNPDFGGRVELPMGGSATPYSLGGLKPGINYNIEAFVDTQPEGSPGSFAPDPFEDKDQVTPGVPLVTGVTYPAMNLTIADGGVAGSTPEFIRLTSLDNGGHQVIAVNTPSGELVVSIRDNNDVLTTTPTPTTVNFFATDNVGTPVPIDMSTNNFVSTMSLTIAIPGGATQSAPFRLRYAGVSGDLVFKALVNNFPDTGQSRASYFSLTALPSGATFTSLNARTTSNPLSTTGTAVSISPDRDGIDDGAVLSCFPPSSTAFWEFLVSTETTFTSGVVHRQFGSGPGQVFWYGFGFDGRIVPSGLYFARFQTAGAGLVSSLMTISVDSAFIKGQVKNGGVTTIPDAVVRVFGPGGGGYALTDFDGQFFVGGLVSSATYSVEINKPSFEPLVVPSVVASTTTNLGVLNLGPGATIRVQATVDTATAYDIFGGVFAHDSTYSSVSNGPLRLSSGALTTDNGRPAADPEYSPFTSFGVRPNVLYDVNIHLPQYGQTTVVGVSTGPGQTINVTPAMTRRANLSGTVSFPAPLSTSFAGEWVSVDAVPVSTGTPAPVAWGGVFVPNGSTGDTYNLFGVSPGTYTLRAFARGYVQNSTFPVVVGTVDLTGVDFPVFNTGGVLTGTITINGDMSGVNTNFFGNCGPGAVSLPINAFEPVNYTNAFTEVCVSTGPGPVTTVPFQLSGLVDGIYNLYTFLEGFQLNPPGVVTATVTAGVGTRNITLDGLSGRLNLNATLAPTHLSGAVLYRVQNEFGGGQSQEGNLSGPLGGPASKAITGLGTGLYTVTLFNANPSSNLLRRVGVSVANGSTATLSIDMAQPTYSISGNVDIQGSLVLPSTWNVTVSSAAGLAAAGLAPEVQVFAFPLPSRFEQNAAPFRKVPVALGSTTGTFTVNGLTPGGYLLRLSEDMNPPGPPANCNGCSGEPGRPEFASTDRVVFIGTAGVSGAHLTLSNGGRLSGAVRRPIGDVTTDPRHFVLRLRRADNLTVWQTDVNTSGAGSAAYSFSRLAPGKYILELFEDSFPVKYAAATQTVDIAMGDVSLDITLVGAATVVGRLRDADADVLVNSQNVGRVLPDNFEIFARANPWVPGGFANAERNSFGPGPALDPESGQFIITRLIPDTTYDVTLRGFSGGGASGQAQGKRTYAPAVVGGVRLAAGQVLDIGTVDLKQGGTLSGTVIRVSDGAPLANVRVVARPSLSNGDSKGNFQVETFTNEQGHYELLGIDRDQRFYDIVAAPRFRGGEVFGQLSGPKFGEEKIRMVDVNDSTALTGHDFSMTPASGVLVGQVTTADGGTLSPPFTDRNNQTGVRGANVVLHFDGTPLDENPLGEIEEQTNADGTFRIDGLKPGSYTFRAISVGYQTVLKKYVVRAVGTTNAGVVTLGLGASASGSITKSDGSSPSSSDVRMVVGVDNNFEDFVFGSVEGNEDSGLVTGYSLTGFRANKDYSLVFVTGKDEILEAATNIVFASSVEARGIDLVFRPAKPKVFVNQSKSGTLNTVRFYTSQPLRDLKDSDNDFNAIVTLSSGTGTITDVTLSSARDILTVAYDAPVNESSFALRLTFNTTVTDPDSPTGDDFLFDEEFVFYGGVARRRSSSIPNVTGGECSLEGVAAGASFPAGTFSVDRSSSVNVGVQTADLLADLPPAAAPSVRGRSRGLGPVITEKAQRLGPNAFPPDGRLYKALLRAPTVDPFSAFYDIFLPAGVSHALKNDALLTMKYDDSITDPSSLNVYYFEPNSNVYLLEKAQRSIDEVNKTITVAVRHLSTFVVLQSAAPIVGTSDFAAAAIQVYNAPNPFRLGTKTVSIAHPNPPVSLADQVTEGTVIAYALPAGKSGEIKIEIYDVAGALVKTISQTAPTAATYYYTDWDGRNDAGQKVAAGVYVARFTLNGSDEKFFKMAVIK